MDEQNLIKMAENIRKFVRRPSVHELIRQKLYIISFNISIVTNSGVHLPNEVGLVEYSIHKGITKCYHKFIDPGPPPFGYMAEAKEHSETTHQIPVLSEGLLDANYAAILTSLFNFVTSQSNNYIIFSHPDQLKQNNACLNWLKYKSQINNSDFNEIWLADISMLLMELRAVSNNPVSSKMIDNILSRTKFDYIANTKCQYHEDLDNPYCALGHSLKLGFHLSDAVAEQFGVELTMQHIPMTENLISFSWKPLHPITMTGEKKDLFISMGSTASNTSSSFEHETDSVIPSSKIKEERTRSASSIVRNVKSVFDNDTATLIVPSKMTEKIPKPMPKSTKLFTMDEFPPLPT